MIFEKEKYYQYINSIEKMITATYVLLIMAGIGIGAFGGILGIILGAFIGFIISTLYTKAAKIKIQEMKWKMDIYEMIYKIEKK